MLQRAIHHIQQTAKIPSFSSFEERLHPYIRNVFGQIDNSKEIEVKGNNLVFQIGDNPQKPTMALAAHLDKINHYGTHYPEELPVAVTDEFIEGAMDDCAGLGIILAVAEIASKKDFPNLQFYFSEMEESKGLKEHPELLKNNGKGYEHGMGARRIAEQCKRLGITPQQVITLDTTPLFKGEKGVALYSKHWELNGLNASQNLIEKTQKVSEEFLSIDKSIKLDNNTNDYLHYGKDFNTENRKEVISVALEPAIFPYHQKGERVFVDDIRRTLDILAAYLERISKAT
ncbi:MAG TPA: M28 family peptidase [Balneolaceae bacterium]|nr:M28 family peptidase [Balneolaceae bacterium]